MAYKFKRNIDIGSLDAESDKFLLSVFLEKTDQNILRDTGDPKCVIVERTGVGKSMLILLKARDNSDNISVAAEP